MKTKSFAHAQIKKPAFRLTARVTGGGWVWIHLRNGKNSKPEPTRFDGENPAVLVHAVLGGTWNHCIMEQHVQMNL